MPASRFHSQTHSNPNRTQFSWIFHPITLLLWVALCLILSFSLWQSVGAMRQSLDREKLAEAKMHAEEKKALDLIDKLNEADTELAREKIIRNELQMQRPGETILQIIETPSPSPSP